MAGNSPPQTPAPPSRRRSSIAELFQPRSSVSSTTSSNGQSSFQSTMSSMQSSRQNNPPRRMSITTALGVSGSPNSQGSTFGSYHKRRDSMSSSQDSGSPNTEEALMEDNESSAPQNTPVSPFARRVSFGAQAFGSVRSGNGGGSFSNGEGFNWESNLREKASRAPPGPAPNASAQQPPQYQRSASVTTMEPPKQMPPPVKQPYKPDHLGERMLRGDFMMD